MKTKMDRIIEYLNDHILNVILGLFITMLTYFAEIKGSVNVMAFAFLFDLIFGICNSIKIKKEKFQMKKFFIQLQRFAIVLIIVMLIFAMDKENEQDITSVYSGVTWLVTGFLIWSIAENGFSLTNWNFFKILKVFIKKETKRKAGINLENPEEDSNIYNNNFNSNYEET